MRERLDNVWPNRLERRRRARRSRSLEVMATCALAVPMVIGLGVPVGAPTPCDEMEPTIVGTNESDVLLGTPGADVIVGAGGDDRIDAGAGDDLVCGGPGADQIFGGGGADQVFGGDGDDMCVTDADDSRPNECETIGGSSDPPFFRADELSVEEITSESVVLTWPIARDDIGLAGYAVLQNGFEVAFDDLTNRSEIFGLQPETTYHFMIVAVDVHGNRSADEGNPNTEITTLRAPAGDRDGDGIRDEIELAIGTDPDLADTDGDGAPDGLERASECDPLTRATTLLRGVVLDPGGAPIAGASVQVSAGPFRASTTTDDAGRFEIADQPACLDLVVVAEATVGGSFERARIEVVPVADGATEVELMMVPTPPESSPDVARAVDATGPLSGSVAADFDGDGLADVAAAVPDLDQIAISFAAADGSLGPFTYLATGDAPARLVAADLDDDGDLDLVTPNLQSLDVSVLLGDGSGGFAAPVAVSVGSGLVDVVVADATGDGVLDLVASSRSGTVWVLAGDGTGSFADGRVVTRSGSDDVVIDDVTDDGVPDLVTTNRFTNRLVVAPGDGAGGFGIAIDLPTPQLDEIELADFNGDGRLDVVAIGGGGLLFLAGDEGGAFSMALPVDGTTAGAFVLADRTGDGAIDIVQLGGDGVLEHVNDGTGHVAVTGTVAFDVAGDRPALGDVDGDGLADVVVLAADRLSVAVFLSGSGAPEGGG